ncbi:hypothetical protein BaRGS_00025504 [Batillaria attramentaria]|uniref:Uncharacterized protein n=1 Tax=Batillaria attramentaria TaxID=370345 RepID=A0ABD0K803_9CAEN
MFFSQYFTNQCKVSSTRYSVPPFKREEERDWVMRPLASTYKNGREQKAMLWTEHTFQRSIVSAVDEGVVGGGEYPDAHGFFVILFCRMTSEERQTYVNYPSVPACVQSPDMPNTASVCGLVKELDVSLAGTQSL